MDLIIWREAFDTGYVRVDNQHKHLVYLINELYKSLGAKNRDQQMRHFFLELFEYTVNHFSMEEMLMREFNYPNYMEHKNEHAQFIIQIKDFKEGYITGKKNINLEVLQFLKEWLLKHIMGTDKITFDYIQSKTSF